MRRECTYNLRNTGSRYGQPGYEKGPYKKKPGLEWDYIPSDPSLYSMAIAELPTERHPPIYVPSEFGHLVLTQRYGNEEEAPLSFLPKAWQRLAQAQIGGRAWQDFPMDYSKPLEFPINDLTWFAQQDLFFHSWIASFHFLHRATSREWLERVMRNKRNGVELWRDVGHARAAVALMTMAIGSLYRMRKWDDRKRDKYDYEYSQTYRDQLFAVAISLTDTETGGEKLESIQARLLQDIYLLCTWRYNQAWYTLGNTLQMISIMGLHRRAGRNRGFGPDFFRAPDYAKIQCERRTFWAAYVLDKHLSMVTGRPAHFSDDNIDQELPDPVNDEDMKPNGPFRDQGDCYMTGLIRQAKYVPLTPEA